MRKVLFLAIAISLFAAMSAQAAEVKIGVFNSLAVANSSEPYMAARKKLEAQYGPEEKKLKTQEAALQKQAGDLQKQQAAMSPEAFAEKSDSFRQAKRNFEDAAQSLNRKVETAAFRMNQEFGGRLAQAVQDYGMRRGFTVLFDTATRAAVYYDKSVDVTDDIVKEVARVYKEGKPLPGQKK